MKRPGRPPLAPEQRRTVELHVRLRPTEADYLCTLALKSGRSLGSVVRRLCLAKIERMQVRMDQL